MSKKRFSIPVIIIAAVLAMTAGFFIGGEAIHLIYARELRGISKDSADRKAAVASLLESPLSPLEMLGIHSIGQSQAIDEQRANAIVRATRKVAPSVVGIVVTQIQVVRNPYAGDNYFDFFFSPDARPQRYRKVENIGSGFVISEDGMIVTNYHVIKNASKLFVSFPDGSRKEGKVLGVDEKSDLALVSVEGGSGFKPALFGNSDRCMIGEWGIALGNPFLNFMNDAHPTVTVGVISAVNRNFAPSEGVYYQGMIQTDAAINPGNSGGPLVNALGEVIGINSFIYTGSGANTGSIGIGFAIPINRARRVVGELIAHGRRRPVWTGITVQNINRPVAEALHYDSVEGVVIVGIKPESPGEAAGLKPGDIILKMGGTAIHSSADLDGFFLDYFVDDSVEIHVVRGGKPLSAKLILKEFTGR